MAIVDTWWEKLKGGVNDIANETGIKDDESQARQRALMDETLAELEGIPLPYLKEISLENPNWLEDLVAAKQGDTEFNSIKSDPELREKQKASLAALDEISANGGFNLTDQANLSKIQSQAGTADRGRRDAIRQNMASRGMGGSGMELLASLQSSQAATDRQAQQGLDVAAMGQQRALDAIMQSGQLAGNVRGQDFSEQAQKASAQDAINRFNTSNTNDVNRYNNQGAQGVENTRSVNQNTSTMYNAGLPQQRYDNAMGKTAMKGQARGQQIGLIGQQSADNRDTNTNMWSGAIKGVTKFFQDDDEKKKDK